MTAKQFLAILRARWASSLAIMALALVAAAALSAVMTKRYTASAAVMLDVVANDPILGNPIGGGAMTTQYLATQVDVVRSERVARRAVQILGLADDPARRAAWQEQTESVGDFETWLAQSLLRSVSVEPSRESFVINISYTDTTAAAAAAAANAFMQGYLDVSVELRVDPARSTNAFFVERVKQSRADLESAQSRLSDYNKDRGLIALNDGRLDVETARLAELSSQYVMLQALAAESSGRQTQAGARPDELPEVLTNATVSQLQSELAREESRLKELSSRLGDAHPQLVEQRARLAELRQRADTAVARASGSVRVTNNVNQSRLAQVKAALDAQRARVLDLKSARDDGAVLQRDVESAQRAYDAALARLTQTGLESKTNQTNISILKRASEPSGPSSPNVMLNLAAAVLLGSALAIGLALVRELLDRRLRSDDDVITVLNQALLVTLPVSQQRRDVADSSRTRAIKLRVFAGLPGPGTRG